MAFPNLAAPDPVLARHQAREILAEPRFHAAPVPRPLHGVLRGLGRVLESPLEFVEELVASLAPDVPGGKPVVWALLAAALLALCALFAVRRSRRALAEPPADHREAPAMQALSAAQLDARATDAERERRYADAVRLRFRAGLVRLAERDVVVLVDSTPNLEVARALSSTRFDSLARDFDEIVYGGRVAVAEDAESARREWREVLRTLGSKPRPRTADAAAVGPLPAR